MKVMHYFYAAIINNLSEKPKYALFYMVGKHRFDYISIELVHYMTGDTFLAKYVCNRIITHYVAF